MINHVRRNKIKNVDFLKFLKEYSTFNGSFYDFILSNSENARQVVNGHELDKVQICSDANDFDKEKEIWEEQSNEFWNGEMKVLISWSRCDGIFSFEEFIRIRSNFHRLFKSKFEKEDWTTDKVRQALIACRLPKYPLGDKFGYSRDEWKEIFSKNLHEMLVFLNNFDDIKREDIPSFLDTIIQNYNEKPENPWAQFVKYDYLLNYCNTKHLYWNDNYGWILVQNSRARPYSVKNMRLYYDLKQKYGDVINEWKILKYVSKDSCVYLQNDKLQLFIDIRYLRKPDDTYYLKVDFSQRNVDAEYYENLKHDLLHYIPSDIAMRWNDEDGRYVWYPEKIDAVHSFISFITQFTN